MSYPTNVQDHSPEFLFGFTKGGQVLLPVMRPVNLPDSASIATDVRLGRLFIVTLGGNRTLAAPTNLSRGYLTWVLRQDATGGRTVTFDPIFTWPGGTAPSISTTANAVTLISGLYLEELGVILCNSLTGFAVAADSEPGDGGDGGGDGGGGGSTSLVTMDGGALTLDGGAISLT